MNDINIVLILCKFKLMLLTLIRSEELPFTTVQVRYSSYNDRVKEEIVIKTYWIVHQNVDLQEK